VFLLLFGIGTFVQQFQIPSNKFYFCCVATTDMTSYQEYIMPAFALAFSPHARDDDNQPCLAVGRGLNIALHTQAALRKGERCFHKLQGHHGTVYALAVSSSGGQDQPLVASGSSDRTVRLWDTHTRECVAVLKGHTSWVKSVAFSPDGRLLASASIDKTVRLWDVVGRQPVDVLRGHTNWVNSVSFSPNGRQLASASHDKSVRLWNVPEGVPGPILQHAHPVWCVAFSPVVGSNLLASGSSDGTVRLWEVSKQQRLCELREHSGVIRSVAFSPDGSQLVSGSGDKTVGLWSVASGTLLKELTGHSDGVKCVAFHPNGKQVASCSWDNTLRIWAVCEWSDRVHQLFGEEMKRLVFCLMCIKDKIESSHNLNVVPRLSMAVWLDIFAYF
jgi:WD40 repeat protein